MTVQISGGVETDVLPPHAGQASESICKWSLVTWHTHYPPPVEETQVCVILAGGGRDPTKKVIKGHSGQWRNHSALGKGLGEKPEDTGPRTNLRL